MINIQDNIAEMSVGNISIGSAYVGSQLVWEKSSPVQIEIEYIENTGASWINTGIIPSTTYYNIEIKFYSNLSDKTNCLLGVRTSFTSLNYSFWTSIDRVNRIRATNGSHSSWGSYDKSLTVLNKECVFKLTNNTAYISIEGSETSWKLTPSTYGAEKPIYLFNCNNNGSINSGWFFVGRIYYCKIWDNNGDLVRDYIPVRVGTTGYLYDNISGELFGNAGTGDFVLGPDVT